jgi:hypothetical protein
MSKSKRPQSRAKRGVSPVRSSAAEYLTFIAATGNAQRSVEMRYEDENLWLTQKMMVTLYGVSVPAVRQHLKRIYADNELEREATVKQYLTVQTEGERDVQRKVDHYSSQAIIAVGLIGKGLGNPAFCAHVLPEDHGHLRDSIGLRHLVWMMQ